MHVMKLIAATIVFVGCLWASILTVCQARHYQIAGQAMPNGKGGFMAPTDGYTIGLALFLLSIASLVAAIKYYRHKR